MEENKFMDNNLVSFIIISYNHAAFIDDCMQAVLEQTYSDIEILYMDDASSDHSYKRAEKYQKKLQEKFDRVLFFENKENQGVVKNLNKLLPMCKGKYIKFLAADDFMLPNGIRDMVEYLEEHPEAAMVYTNGVYGDEQTHFQKNMPYDEMKKIYSQTPPSGENLFLKLYERDFITAPAVMLCKSTYDEIGMYDENIAVEDWDCCIRVSLYGQIGYLDKCTVLYRFLSTSFSHSADPHRRAVMKKNELLLLEKYKEYVGDNGKERIEKSYNEAVSDACHIGDKEYMVFLKEYREKNHVRVTMRNRMKYVLYRAGFIRLLEHKRN